MNELHNFTLLFLAMLAVSTLMRLYLSHRQVSYVSSHRGKVPESFAVYVPREFWRPLFDRSVSGNARQGER